MFRLCSNVFTIQTLLPPVSLLRIPVLLLRVSNKCSLSGFHIGIRIEKPRDSLNRGISS